MHSSIAAIEFLAAQPAAILGAFQFNGGSVEVLPAMRLVRVTFATANAIEVFSKPDQYGFGLALPPSLAGYRVYIDPTPAAVTA